MTKAEERGALVARTRELLQLETDKPKGQRRSLFTIAVESEVPFSWLRKFKNGSIADPGTSKVEALYNYLSPSPLRVSRTGM